MSGKGSDLCGWIVLFACVSLFFYGITLCISLNDWTKLLIETNCNILDVSINTIQYKGDNCHDPSSDGGSGNSDIIPVETTNYHYNVTVVIVDPSLDIVNTNSTTLCLFRLFTKCWYCSNNNITTYCDVEKGNEIDPSICHEIWETQSNLYLVGSNLTCYVNQNNPLLVFIDKNDVLKGEKIAAILFTVIPGSLFVCFTFVMICSFCKGEKLSDDGYHHLQYDRYAHVDGGFV